ncbi:hypothetical protein AURDEDRAFT_178224 [Auricularia subglabra TFB-10046 SS5]|uniref:Uncharacterized protein n=1 Tax=Auricularia subglabra (strain TFB-10046 / SS5) TaxID=717982 RepID=J0D242_AURST|nr:hypothetical protein AURDEDRAFT_178224 [Auricularia subglabra TFB-10046 SS5]
MLHKLRLCIWRPHESFMKYFIARTRLQRAVFGTSVSEEVLVLDVLSGIPEIVSVMVKGVLGDIKQASLTHPAILRGSPTVSPSLSPSVKAAELLRELCN